MGLISLLAVYNNSPVARNTDNSTDSHLKGENAATQPAFWMKMTLMFIPTAQVRLLIHLGSVYCGARACSVRWSTAVEVRWHRTLSQAETFRILPWSFRFFFFVFVFLSSSTVSCVFLLVSPLSLSLSLSLYAQRQ